MNIDQLNVKALEEESLWLLKVSLIYILYTRSILYTSEKLYIKGCDSVFCIFNTLEMSYEVISLVTH